MEEDETEVEREEEVGDVSMELYVKEYLEMKENKAYVDTDSKLELPYIILTLNALVPAGENYEKAALLTQSGIFILV